MINMKLFSWQIYVLFAVKKPILHLSHKSDIWKLVGCSGWTDFAFFPVVVVVAAFDGNLSHLLQMGNNSFSETKCPRCSPWVMGHDHLQVHLNTLSPPAQISFWRCQRRIWIFLIVGYVKVARHPTNNWSHNFPKRPSCFDWLKKSFHFKYVITYHFFPEVILDTIINTIEVKQLIFTLNFQP